MKKFLHLRFIFSALAAACLLTACGTIGEDLRTGWHDKINGAPPSVHETDAGPDEVYKVAQAVMADVGFKVGRKNRDDRRLEGYSRLSTGNDFRGTRQLRMETIIESRGDGGSIINVRLYEMVESDNERFGGQGTEAPHRSPAVAERFFQRLDAALAAE